MNVVRQFDAAAFFAVVRARMGGLRQPQVAPLEGIVRATLAAWSDTRWSAYALATTKRETGDEFEPINEMGPRSYFDKYEPGTEKGAELGNVTPGDGYRYRGRSLVQVTGLRNYVVMDMRLGLDGLIVRQPDALVRRPDDPAGMTADELDAWALRARVLGQRVLIVGMEEGIFTGRRLENYIVGERCDYFSARRIINALDHAEEIAANARIFQVAIEAGLAAAA